MDSLRNWSKEEISILKENYISIPQNELLLLLPHRSWPGILSKAHKLKMKSNILWSDAELSILLQCYPNHVHTEILKALPKRNWNAIKRKAGKLGIERKISYFAERIDYEPAKTDLSYGEIGWSAGFLDGEGTISIRRAKVKNRISPTYTTFVQADNVKIESLYKLQAMFGGSVHPSRVTIGKVGRPLFHWAIAAKRAVRCLLIILPYLCLKNEQAKICLELDRIQQAEKHFHQISQLCLTRGQLEARDILYMKCRALNFKGQESKYYGLQPTLGLYCEEGKNESQYILLRPPVDAQVN